MIVTSIKTQCEKAYAASYDLACLSPLIKNHALQIMADSLLKETAYILKENQKDLNLGKKKRLTNALLDRLTLSKARIHDIANNLRALQNTADPIGKIDDGWKLPNGIDIQKVRVPLGVVGIIYEARPNVTADAIGLCLKTGNSIVLRGSSSAFQSNLALCTVLKNAAKQSGVNSDAIQLLEDTSRSGVEDFVRMKKYLSVIIPRGGAALIQNVVKNATVPTIETGVGNCHIYIDKDADLDKALAIVINAKVQRPSVCNACETVLVHSDISSIFIPRLVNALQKNNVTIRGCHLTKALAPTVSSAQPSDWKDEFLDLVLAVKIVSSIDDAIQHIRTYGTLHTEAIISENISAISHFQQAVDAAAIVINASTRFTDGGEFGFGAEMGISTQKLHARGPMGLHELTTYKYIVKGSGQIRE